MIRNTSSYKKDTSIKSSIAFLPAIIATSFFLLALGILYFESTSLSASIEKRLPFQLAKDEENARLILNTLAAGIISLTVFSFSMVMIVLSQASSNFSPRVIPGLTTARAHQIVLGFYIGTIVYTLLLLLSYKAEPGDNQSVPSIGILIGLIFGIICIILFVYFIHSVSKAIQVDNILNIVFQKAKVALEHENEIAIKNKTQQLACIISWQCTIHSYRDGYLKELDLEWLLELAIQHDLELEVLVQLGSFIVSGTPILRLTTDITENKALVEELENCFCLDLQEIVMDDYEQGVRQITEIAVKALSPGINDPGTAIKSIDFITLLFIYRIRCQDLNCLTDKDGQVRVVDFVMTIDELLHRYFTPIRTYGKGDIQIVTRLLRCLVRMLQQKEADNHKPVIIRHAQAIASDIEEVIKTKLDRERFNEAVEEINGNLPTELRLKPLMVHHNSKV